MVQSLDIADIGVVQYREWFAQCVEHVDVPVGFRYLLWPMLCDESAVLVEELDRRIRIVGIDADGPFVFVVERHGTIGETAEFVKAVFRGFVGGTGELLVLWAMNEQHEFARGIVLL